MMNPWKTLLYSFKYCSFKIGNSFLDRNNEQQIFDNFENLHVVDSSPFPHRTKCQRDLNNFAAFSLQMPLIEKKNLGKTFCCDFKCPIHEPLPTAA
jgi:hypothetical protein